MSSNNDTWELKVLHKQRNNYSYTHHRSHDDALPQSSHNPEKSDNDYPEADSHKKCTPEQVFSLGECGVLVHGEVDPQTQG